MYEYAYGYCIFILELFVLHEFPFNSLCEFKGKGNVDLVGVKFQCTNKTRKYIHHYVSVVQMVRVTHFTWFHMISDFCKLR